jgi:hypothetical protein
MIRYALAIMLVAVSVQALAEDQPAISDRARGLELWSKIHEVFSHPRCANCHVGEDRVPMWSGPEYGPAPRPHGMNISAKGGDDGAHYLACTTCHTNNNSEMPHGPPGAAGWHLAPVEMQWFGRSSAEICTQIKTPALTRNRDVPAIAEHVKTEALVRWAWTVESKRRPPYSAEELGKLVEDWNTAGAPCPK